MPYAPTDWVNGTTPLNDANLDHIEQGITDAHAGLPPSPSGQDGKFLSVAGGAMVWAVPSGGGVDYENDWAAGTPYQQGDVVIHNGVQYLAVNPSTGSTPPAAQSSPALTPIPLVTSLPVSPFDGQEVILTDSLTAPTYQWRLRYSAGITDAYKWVFVGGPPACVDVQAVETTSATAYADLATVGPQFAVPRAGNYLAEFTVEQFNSSTGANFTVLKRGAAAESDNDAAVNQVGTSNLAGAGRSIVVLGLAAGDLLKLRYKTSGGTASFRKREFRVTPMRLA